MKTAKSILLVEDNEDDRFVFIEALNNIANATLFDVANNGKEAIDKLQNPATLPDLIFIDINMPVMNGIECLAEIVTNPLMKHIPVIMVSTDTTKAGLTLAMGARAFIKKLSDFDSLRAQLEELINLDFMVDGHIANQTFQIAAKP